MARPVRTDQEIAGAFGHLCYELDMLWSTANALHAGVSQDTVRYALLESFIIHARNLIHFLDPVNAKRSDVIADDLLDDPGEWQSARGELPERLAHVRQRANKEVAHLTYDRLLVTEATRGWNCRAIALEIKERFDRFAETLDPNVFAKLRDAGDA
jgi:hypothetical protein